MFDELKQVKHILDAVSEVKQQLAASASLDENKNGIPDGKEFVALGTKFGEEVAAATPAATQFAAAFEHKPEPDIKEVMTAGADLAPKLQAVCATFAEMEKLGALDAHALTAKFDLKTLFK